MSTAWYKPNRLPKRMRSWTSSTSCTSASTSTRTCESARASTHSGASSGTDHGPRPRRSIEVWDTTCVVTNMNSVVATGNNDNHTNTPKATPRFSVLINPGNPSLSGVSRFAYFPVGGPEPPKSFRIGKDSHPIMGYVTSWGGMEVGNGMAFASNTVDGLVHLHGGAELADECRKALLSSSSSSSSSFYLSNWWERLRRLGSNAYGDNDDDNDDHHGRLAEGTAVATRAAGKLPAATGYQWLVHTVPPFFGQDHGSNHERNNNPERVSDGESDNSAETASTTGVREHNEFLLAECYRNALETASSLSLSSTAAAAAAEPRQGLFIACPLLGAGCRGFPTERAIEVAARATTHWMTMAATPTTQMKTQMTATTTPTTTATPLTTLAFGIPDGDIRDRLVDAIDRAMEELSPEERLR